MHLSTNCFSQKANASFNWPETSTYGLKSDERQVIKHFKIDFTVCFYENAKITYYSTKHYRAKAHHNYYLH